MRMFQTKDKLQFIYYHSNTWEDFVVVLGGYVSIATTSGVFTACKHALDDSFGHLNITYNERFSPDCVWTLGNSGISDPVAIVSIAELHLGYCR